MFLPHSSDGATEVASMALGTLVPNRRRSPWACLPGKQPQSPEHLKPQPLDSGLREAYQESSKQVQRSVCRCKGWGLHGPHLESSGLCTSCLSLKTALQKSHQEFNSKD